MTESNKSECKEFFLCVCLCVCVRVCVNLSRDCARMKVWGGKECESIHLRVCVCVCICMCVCLCVCVRGRDSVWVLGSSIFMTN